MNRRNLNSIFIITNTYRFWVPILKLCIHGGKFVFSLGL